MPITGEEKNGYTIGKVSSLLGISPEGLRLYERNGIIEPEKDEKNGYRYYSHLDISALVRSLTYRSYNFSMREASRLLNTSDITEVRSIYAGKAKELKKEILWQQMRLQYLEQMVQLIEEAETGLKQCQVVESPGMYRLEFMEQHKIFLDEMGEKEFRHWVELVPFTFFAMRCPLSSLLAGKTHIVSALGIMEEYADFFHIKKTKYVTYHPPRRAVYTIVREGESRFDSADCFAHVFSFLEEHGLQACGDSIARTFVSLNKKESYTRYRQVWLPVEERGEKRS